MAGVKFGVSGSPAEPRRINRKQMVFVSNPLSLSVTEPAFESWIRDSGYLEILDQRTSDLHRLDKSSTATGDPRNPSLLLNGLKIISRLVSSVWILLSLFTFNPLSKLSAQDFSVDAPPWTRAFWGSLESYSFPASTSQARLRVQENVKCYCRNYATLFAIFCACSLYKMPIALLGLVSCLAIWDAFRFGSDQWGLDKHPVIKQTLMLIAQCVTAVVLFMSNLQFAVFCALCLSYAVTVLHASFRKLNSGRQPAPRDPRRR